MGISMRWMHLLVLLLGVLLAGQTFAQPPNQTEYDVAKTIVEKVRAGQTTPEKAIEDGLLTRPVLLAIVGDATLLDEGRGLWNPSQETYRWTGLLIERFPEIFEAQTYLGHPVRVRLALYFNSKRDPRGPQIMEAIIAEMPRDKPDTQVLLAVLYNLSNHYRYIGDNDKAIEASLKVREFETTPTQRSNILLGAARAAYSAGDKAQAMQIYDEVIALDYGWATGHAYSDLAGYLFAEGKIEEARALLKKPITGLNGDQFRVVLNQRLAQSYMETGEWDEAQRWAQATIDQYKSLADPIKNHGLESYPQMAQSLLEQIKQWQKSPVQLQTRELKVRFSKDATEPVRTYFTVGSYRKITVKSASDNPHIKIWPLRGPHGYNDSSHQMIGVEVSPDILKVNGKAELVISIAEFPDFTARISVDAQEKP